MFASLHCIDSSTARATARKLLNAARLTWACMLATTISASMAQAAPIVPSGLAPGAKYHLVFVTSTRHQGDFGNGSYAPGGNLPGVLAGDFIVNSTTVGGNQPGAWTATASYKAILSDSTRDAITLVTDSSPVYNVQGQLVAHTYASMFQGSSTSLVNAVRYDEFGNSVTFGAWTGTTSTGFDNGLTGADWTGGAGPLTRGAPLTGSSTWINSGANSNFVQPLRLYGISEELTVPVPEPASLVLLGLGGILAWRRQGRRRTQGQEDSSDRTTELPHRQSPPKIQAAILCVAAGCLVALTNTATAQPPGLDLGALANHGIGDIRGGDGFELPPLFTRAPTKRLDCYQTGPLFDQNFYRAETVTIGGPERPTSAPDFAKDAFNLDGSLVNPGHRYRSITKPSSPDVGTGSGFNGPAGYAHQFAPPDGSRFRRGDFTINNGSFTANIEDGKNSANGASEMEVSWSETYELTGPIFSPNGTYSFGGAFGVNVTLPLSSPFPGAAAASLTTHMVTNGNLYDGAGNILADVGCHELPTIVAAVSEGTSDGVDNNVGPHESYFGNADFGVVTPGGQYLGADGAVTMSRTLVGGDALHQIRGSWVTDPFYVTPFNPIDPVLVTFYHTATLIADPGAVVSMAPISEADLAVLPHDADFFVIATGSNVPEPHAAAMAAIGIVTTLGAIRRRQTR